MGFKEIFGALKNRLSGSDDDERPELDDMETRDKRLRSLRREMRVINEAKEKEFLINRIREIRRQEVAQGMFGFKRPMPRQKVIKRKVGKILNDSMGMLGTMKPVPKRKRGGML